MNTIETDFNALYQKTIAFYENAMNGDKTHPFVLFKIKQLRLKKSNFKKVKEIDNELLANALRTILYEDLNTFVTDVKEYELKMKTIKEAKKASKPQRKPYNKQQQRPRQNSKPQYQQKPAFKPKFTNDPEKTIKPVAVPHTITQVAKEEPVQQVKKQNKSNEKYLRSMNFKKKGKR